MNDIELIKLAVIEKKIDKASNYLFEYLRTNTFNKDFLLEILSEAYHYEKFKKIIDDFTFKKEGIKNNINISDEVKEIRTEKDLQKAVQKLDRFLDKYKELSNQELEDYFLGSIHSELLLEIIDENTTILPQNQNHTQNKPDEESYENLIQRIINTKESSELVSKINDFHNKYTFTSFSQIDDLFKGAKLYDQIIDIIYQLEINKDFEENLEDPSYLVSDLTYDDDAKEPNNDELIEKYSKDPYYKILIKDLTTNKEFVTLNYILIEINNTQYWKIDIWTVNIDDPTYFHKKAILKIIASFPTYKSTAEYLKDEFYMEYNIKTSDLSDEKGYGEGMKNIFQKKDIDWDNKITEYLNGAREVFELKL
ncbi:hypothetical protein KMW28_12900 [Flammeovirga yaeyamensis]|uniref:Uncharacterized protein n=1 Tax=Flammeovirga yaeyamensis TaxID=367791 RepID=A0AAX1MZ74_9BACT|nr:hypothetical protein [Flammeovirga yaeyamensis]MBB3695932.1 hypothetical protein [Flammeovirga yaeyamensis]NMF34620.1 hypothetical protein [Flammeovirga yaeyamensis]QWG00550.1 hypothetical protein KMW28_12900 [Flammeovirga yaeyamensis]